MDTSTATAAMPAPINTQTIVPASAEVNNALNPTATRYGWGMFGPIDLYGGSGSVNLHVQPAKLNIAGVVGDNPYHRILPAKQLIPFPTFDYITQLPSSDKRDGMGRALLETTTSLMSSLDAIVLVMQRYGHWGFANLLCLDGMEQSKAMRVFAVVQPLQYSMKDMMSQLEYGYEVRRDQTTPFEVLPGYIVEPLRDESERALADRLAGEMLVAADIAFRLANQILDESQTSIVTRLSGGIGKTGGDPLDRRLMLELNRTLPTVQTVHGGGAAPDLTDIRQDVKSLVDHAKMQSMEAELAAYRAGVAPESATISASADPTQPESVESPEVGSVPPASGSTSTICGVEKNNGEPCRTVTGGGPCSHHKDK